MKKHTGFTLVELAIVLVVIGLIMGMAFKGRDLIEGAKVKNMQAQYNKVAAAFNIFYEKYGSFPGDGCTAAVLALGAGTVCPAGNRDGSLGNTFETESALNALVNANILTVADLQSVAGQNWAITPSSDTTLGGAGSVANYLSLTSAAGAPQAAADVRYVCALDKMMDDGVNSTGSVRSATSYAVNNDCWALAGQATIGVRLLP